MKFKTRLKHSASLIDLTPLVDVIFLMLIFFIVTSDILPLKSLNIVNPSLSEDSTPLTTQLPLVVDRHQVIYLGSKKTIIDLGSLKEQLEEEIAKYKKNHQGVQPTLVFHFDEKVEYGLFLKLLATAQTCCANIRLAYQTDEAEE
ncbi:MAG: biopolymer transporter ExbD [Parachlamydia sp.]|jgi:biopolymer transport protein ExbD|nr:biopolymer transporter ExbD [Parachlamydia sp.]